MEHETDPVRFFLPNGDHLSVRVLSNETFGIVKDRIWKKKMFPPVTLRDYVVKMVNASIFFEDDDPISRLTALISLFEEKTVKPGQKRIIEAEIYPKNDFGDAFKIAQKRPLAVGAIAVQGFLLRKGRMGLRRRYFVIQGHVLFCFESDSAFEQKKQALELWKVNCSRTRDLGDNTFEIELNQPGMENLVLKAETAEDRNNWVTVFERMMMRRVKLITLNGTETLLGRDLTAVEGIFRVSGSKDMVDRLQEEYDRGNLPDLSQVRDDHAIAGLVKQQFRLLNQPLIPYANFDQFVAVTTGRTTQEEKTQRLQNAVNALPRTNLALLEFLMLFLNKVAQFEEHTKMDMKNLALVFAPSILRASEDYVSNLNATPFAIETVRFIIEQAPSIWKTDSYTFPSIRHTGTYMADRVQPVKISGPPPLPPTSASRARGLTHVLRISRGMSRQPPGGSGISAYPRHPPVVPSSPRGDTIRPPPRPDLTGRKSPPPVPAGLKRAASGINSVDAVPARDDVRTRESFQRFCGKMYPLLHAEQANTDKAWEELERFAKGAPLPLSQSEVEEINAATARFEEETEKWFYAAMEEYLRLAKNMESITQRAKNRVTKQLEEERLRREQEVVRAAFEEERRKKQLEEEEWQRAAAAEADKRKREVEEAERKSRKEQETHDQGEATRRREEEERARRQQEEDAAEKTARVLITQKGVRRVVVVYEHNGMDEDGELPIEVGDILEVLDDIQGELGWWTGRKEDGTVGLFPSNYTKPLE